MEASGANVQRLTYAGYYNATPSWSPVGNKLAFAGWLDRLAKDDPDGTVRKIVQFHRTRAADLKQVGYRGD